MCLPLLFRGKRNAVTSYTGPLKTNCPIKNEISHGIKYANER